MIRSYPGATGVQEDQAALKVNLFDWRHRRLGALCTVAALCLALTACSGDGDIPDRPVSQLNVQEKVAKTLSEAAEGSIKQNDYQAAVVYYARLLEREPENPVLIAGLSRSLRLVRQPAQAKGYVDKGLLVNKDHPLLLAELGKAQLAMGDSMDAIETLSKADTVSPDVWETILALGVAFDRIGMYDQSERRYKRAMKLTPKNINVLNNYALSLAQAGQFEKATAMLEEAAGLPDATSKVRQNLAMMYALQGEMGKAEGLLRRDLTEEAANENLAYYRDVQTQKRGGLPKEVLQRLEQSATISSAPLASTPQTTGVELIPVEKTYIATRETIVRSLPAAGATRVGSLSEGDKIFVAGVTIDGTWALVEQGQKVFGYAMAENLRDQSLSTTQAPAVKSAPVAPIVANKVEYTTPTAKNPTPQAKPSEPTVPTPVVTTAVPTPRQKPPAAAIPATQDDAKVVDKAAATETSAGASAKPVVNSNYRVGQTVSDCDRCPQIVVIPAGEFMMGAAPGEARRSQREMPQHKVVIPRSLGVSKFEITFEEWDACVADGGCNHRSGDEGWGRERRPVINVSWHDAQEYVNWLSKRSGQVYRLLSEAEWEYATRAGTQTPYHSGNEMASNQARFKSVSGASGQEKSVTVGRYPPNLFGLHDLHGNVREWTEDCRHENFRNAPSDGGSWVNGGNCDYRVIRGGSWGDRKSFLRSAYRSWTKPNSRSYAVGLRVARELN